MHRTIRSAAVAVAAVPWLVASTMTAPSSVASPAARGLCHQHVGGTTIASYSQRRHAQCTLYGPGTLTVQTSASIGQLVLADGLTFLSQGTGKQFDRGRGVELDDSSVFENAGTFTTGERTSFVGDPTALVRNDVGATWSSGTANYIGVPIVNDGTMTAENHTTISMPYLASLSDGVLSPGAYVLTPNAHMEFSGTVSTNQATLVEGAGSKIRTPSGGDALAPLSLNSGSLETDVAQPVGNLTNDGTLHIDADGAILPSGPTALTANSQVDIDIASGPSFGAIRTPSSATIGGTLAIATDPIAYPVPGSTYTIVSAPGGVTGRFSSVTGLDLPDGDHYEVTYTDTSVGLVVVSGQQIPLTVSSSQPVGVGQGARGFHLTLTGTGFAPGALVGFGDASVLATQTTVIDNTSIVVAVSAGNNATIGPRDVRVRLPGQGVAVCSACLRVNAGPAVATISGPAAVGTNRAPLTLSGSGLRLGAIATVTGMSTGITGTITTASGTKATLQLKLLSTVQPGTYSLHLRNADGGMGGCSDCITVIAAPTITSIAPSSIGRGKSATLAVTGTGFSADATVTGPNGVTFGAVVRTDAQHLSVPITVSGSTVPGPNQTITVTDGAAGGFGSATFAGLTIT